MKPLFEGVSKPEKRLETCTCEVCQAEFEGEVTTYHIGGETKEFKPSVCPGCEEKRRAQEEKEAEIAARNERFDRLARYSNMPLKTASTHLLMTFLPGPGTQKALQAAINFIAVNDDGTPKREHHFLTLAGEPGRGKTHLALAVGWQWLGQDMGNVRYWQVSELLDKMRSEFDSPPKDGYGVAVRGEFEACKHTGLLILDDLGVEKTTEWVADKLDTLINHRWLEEKPTIFTTNLTPNQLMPRIRSRIKEGVVVTLEGHDYRELKAKMRKEASNAVPSD